MIPLHTNPRTSDEPRPDNVVRLRDQRILGYAEYGDPGGRPFFLFHGLPGSRVTGRIAHEAGLANGVRVIAPDRPGFGLSAYQPHRSFLDWPEDVVQLAEALGVGRFAVGGISGGGPYAAACAYAIPQRLTGCAIISGVGPMDAPAAREGMSRMNHLLFSAAKYLPALAAPPMFVIAFVSKRWPERAKQQMLKAFPEPDRRVLQRGEFADMFLQDGAEAFRSGVRGAVQETGLVARPWPFRLQDIAMPVHLWQGGADVNVPLSMGKYQASAIPDCRSTFYPDEGHLLVVDHIDEILRAVAA